MYSELKPPDSGFNTLLTVFNTNAIETRIALTVNLLSFAIFSKIKIEGGWVKITNFGKIKTKDRNFCARYFGKIGLKIEGGGVSESIFSLLKIEILRQLLMSLLIRLHYLFPTTVGDFSDIA